MPRALCALALLLLACTGQAQPPNPTNIQWVDDYQTWSNPLKVCASGGYLGGDFCFPLGPRYANGVTVSYSIGETYSLSAEFAHGGASLTAGYSFTVTQTYSHTAPLGQVCQLWVCVPARHRPWDCTCFLDWIEWECNTWVFTTSGEPTILATCAPLDGSGGSATCGGGVVQPGNEGSFLSVDLRRYFELTTGTPPAGHSGTSAPQSFRDLDRWQRCALQCTIRDIDLNPTNAPLTHLVVRDRDGTTHAVDLRLGPLEPDCVFVLERGSRVGERAEILVDAPTQPGLHYVLAGSFGTWPGIPLPGGHHLPLNMDLMMWITFNAPGIFQSFTGVLDSDGLAHAAIAYPPEPSLVGWVFFIAGVTLDPLLPDPIVAVSFPHEVHVEG